MATTDTLSGSYACHPYSATGEELGHVNRTERNTNTLTKERKIARFIGVIFITLYIAQFHSQFCYTVDAKFFFFLLADSVKTALNTDVFGTFGFLSLVINKEEKRTYVQ